MKNSSGGQSAVAGWCLDQKSLEQERSNPRKLSQFDQIKRLSALKEQFEFVREATHHPLVQAGDSGSTSFLTGTTAAIMVRDTTPAGC